MAGTLQRTQPTVETEIRIGNTTYFVAAHFATQGVTVSEKIKRLLDKETKKNRGELVKI